MHLLGLSIAAVLVFSAACAGPQQWTKPAASTTCEDWTSRMSAEQRMAMTGPMLYDAVVGLGADPSMLTDEMMTDEALTALADQITDACADEPRVAPVPRVLSKAMSAEIERVFREVEDNLRSP